LTNIVKADSRHQHLDGLAIRAANPRRRVAIEPGTWCSLRNAAARRKSSGTTGNGPENEYRRDFE
jgi:hypothetical protein